MERTYYSLPETDITWRFHDGTGEMAERITKRWLLQVQESNPGMLLMLEERNRRPYRELLPWSGEFAGKHLTGAVEIYLLTGSEELKEQIEFLTGELERIQSPDGYIGPWAEELQLTGHTPNSVYDFGVSGEERQVIPNWDAWDFYHLMYGLLLWNRASGSEGALRTAKRLADLLYREFYEKGRPLSAMGTPETNLAPVHSLALLYEITGEKRYLAMAESLVEEFALPGGPDYKNLALAGKHFYEMPIPRWEGLHSILGLSVLHEATGKEEYEKAFLALWESMRETDRHNTGGFTSGEAACGNPYDERAIETCCTVAWMAVTTQKLRMTKDPLAADELELSYYNGGLGAISPSGRWCTYNTPMDGYRMPSFREIGFQVRPGTPELNCCSVNAPRVTGLLSQWGIVLDEDHIYVNYYGNYEADFSVEGTGVSLRQESAWPADGEVRITVRTEEQKKFSVFLRIPAWAENTCLTVDGIPFYPQPGSYARLERSWEGETVLTFRCPMCCRSMTGQREKEGKICLYRGPLLLAYDPAFSDGDEKPPVFSSGEAAVRSAEKRADRKKEPGGNARGGILVQLKDVKSEPVTLCDFRSAGYTGSRYRTWFDLVSSSED